MHVELAFEFLKWERVFPFTQNSFLGNPKVNSTFGELKVIRRELLFWLKSSFAFSRQL